MSLRFGICHDYGALDDRVIMSLPDADHIHLHRQPDGTITAVPMRLAVITETGEAIVVNDAGADEWIANFDAWVDAPTGGDA